MRKKFTLLIMSAALLLGSGSMAWGQTGIQMDCQNAFGAGESRWPTRGTSKITTDTYQIIDGALVTDASTAPYAPIIIGTVLPNVVGEKWVGTDYNNTNDSPYFNGLTGQDCTYYTGGTCSTSNTCYGNAASKSATYVGCDNTFFRNYAGTHKSGTMWASTDFASSKETVVEIEGGTLGIVVGQTTLGSTLTNALDYDYLYFRDIPWEYPVYTFTRVNGTPCPSSCGGCTPKDATYSTSYVNGFVAQGRMIVDAGSHIHILNDVSAEQESNSKAIIDLPSTGARYSWMIDGQLRADRIYVQGNNVGEINNMNPMLANSIIGVNNGYYYGSAPAAAGGKIITNGSGGTILIGSTTQGQDKMEITETTATTSPAGGFSSDLVYSGTDIGVTATANLGNYGNNAMTIRYSTSLFGPTNNNVGKSAMQIYNHSCNSLTFNNQPFVININDVGYLLVEGYQNVNFDISQRLTADDKGRTIINGGNVYINAYHDFFGYNAPAVPADMYYSINAYKNGQPGWNGKTYCGIGNITTGTSAVVHVTNSDAGHSRWYADHTILTQDGVYFTNTGTGTTDWYATNNILTKDTVIFDHSGATAMLANGNRITLWADTGDIAMDKKVNFLMANDSSINILAENLPVHGNISFFDSTAIKRTNTGTPVGTTNIVAGNNIYTAMFDFESVNTNGDNTNVISHMGDIWLGYNNDINNPTLPAHVPISSPHSTLSYDRNIFRYNIPVVTPGGKLNIKAGYKDLDQSSINMGGGNIYFTHIVETLKEGGLYNTEVSIPFSNKYYCGNTTYGTNDFYEQAGIIGGVARCQINVTTPTPAYQCVDTGLIYRGYNGELLFDAGTRGNIIINNGSYLTFQGGTGNAKFLTRWGDIDMRYPFNVDSMQGSLLFLANSELPNKLNPGLCGCEEKRNNVYLQDFQYNPVEQSGSIFIGADNNIKLQYGGLKGSDWNMNQRDPFYSGDAGYPCGKKYHCDSDTSVNQARDLILDFHKTTAGDITSGGFAAVASDLIDVYTYMEYIGGKGSGMSSVPGYGNLHGESVAGYGLYIKTQANKNNWNHNAFDIDVNACWPPKCDDTCSYSILQNTARVTFHNDARIYTEQQRTYIGSPVLETFGNLDLNTYRNKGGKTSITIQTDSLIVHDSLIIDGKLTNFTTWSGLYRDMPIIKLGHHRFTPPFVEDGTVCAPCFRHEKGTGTYAKRTALDTLYVTYRNGAAVPRLHTLVADHTVLSFLTDSFDHVKGDPTINAKFYTDTFKVRNHVELYTDAKHERDGHFELISEEQMDSKDYAGIYARHLHMEPAAPTCDDYRYSQLWMQDPALDVITTSTFGGYGWIHADVHVEIEATLAPGYASLRTKGDYCHELKAGTLKMQDLRLDKGSQLRFSIGQEPGFQDELADCIDVDEITMYGSVFITVEKRCNQRFEEGCYPIIRYNSVAVDTVNLNNLQLATRKIDGYKLSLDTSTPGIVYLCVGETTLPEIRREIYIPQTEGVTTKPDFGTYYIASMDNFTFSAQYTTPQPLKVTTNRVADDGKAEELIGKLNANGEYVYVIRRVQQNIVLKFGPDYATDNISIEGRAIWSHNNTIYFRVEKEDIASIYSVAGQLVKRLDLPEGSSSISIDRGVYIVTLKDGSVHKVIVK